MTWFDYKYGITYRTSLFFLAPVQNKVKSAPLEPAVLCNIDLILVLFQKTFTPLGNNLPHAFNAGFMVRMVNCVKWVHLTGVMGQFYVFLSMKGNI